MRYEIYKHWEKLKKISKLTDEQLEISPSQVLTNCIRSKSQGKEVDFLKVISLGDKKNISEKEYTEVELAE